MRWEVTRLFDLPPDKVDVVPNGIDLDALERPTPRATVAPARASDVRRRAARCSFRRAAGVGEGRPHAARRDARACAGASPALRLVVAGRRAARDRACATRRAGSGSDGPWCSPGSWPSRTCRAHRRRRRRRRALASTSPSGSSPSRRQRPARRSSSRRPAAWREIVEPGVTGATFPAGDVDGLVGAVSSMLTDQVLAQRTVRAAHRRVSRDLRWSSVADRVLQTYRARRRRGARPAGASVRTGRPAAACGRA